MLELMVIFSPWAGLDEEIEALLHILCRPGIGVGVGAGVGVEVGGEPPQLSSGTQLSGSL